MSNDTPDQPPVCPSCGPLDYDEVCHPDYEEIVQLDLDMTHLERWICALCGEELELAP